MYCILRRYNLVLAASAALLISSASAQTARAAIIINGDFETNGGDISQSAPPWSFDAGNVRVRDGNPSIVDSDGNGDAAIQFGGAGGGFTGSETNGVLSQSFSTAAGQKYFLSFDFGKFGTGTGAYVLDVDVFDGIGFGGTQILDQTVSDSSGTSPVTYNTFDFQFTALSGTSTLRFSDATVSGASKDGALDNVIITTTPECSTFVLMSIGGLLMSCSSRRRRNRY